MSIQARENKIKPFLRWAGGKTWFTGQLQELIAGRDFTDYYEPFLGGGSIFFSLNFENSEIHLSDANSDLISTYIAVRDNPTRIVEFIDGYQNTEQFYYSLREKTPEDFYERAAKFIFLNQTSYNGIYRVNKRGQYNVPYGRRNIHIDPNTIFDASEALNSAHIVSCDFAKALEDVPEGALVFIDPPYTVSHNNNGFVEYNQKIFSIEDQRRVAESIEKLKRKDAYYVLTNAAHDEIRNIFKYAGEPIAVERSCTVGGRNATRGTTQELVFTNLV